MEQLDEEEVAVDEAIALFVPPKLEEEFPEEEEEEPPKKEEEEEEGEEGVDYAPEGEEGVDYAQEGEEGEKEEGEDGEKEEGEDAEEVQDVVNEGSAVEEHPYRQNRNLNFYVVNHYAMKWLAQWGQNEGIPKKYTPCRFHFSVGGCRNKDCLFSHEDIFWEDRFAACLSNLCWRSGRRPAATVCQPPWCKKQQPWWKKQQAAQ